MTILTFLFLNIMCVLFTLSSFATLYYITKDDKIKILFNAIYAGISLQGIILMVLKVAGL